MWKAETNIEIFKPSFIWPNPAFHFRLYYASEKCRVFLIENIAHNWNWLKRYRQDFRENDYFFVQLGWYFDEHLVQECNHIFNILGLRSDRFIFMFADYPSKSMFEYFGFKGEIINHNCFLDENLFDIGNAEKIYDAIYTARLAPFKRHFLASRVPNLALIAGNTSGAVIGELPAHKYLNDRQLSPPEVMHKLSESKVGLILSELEGACYSSSEYLLCGLPVVSTRPYGGRDVWYNSYNSIVCDPNPEAVADAVQKLASYNRDPVRIRKMHIDLAKQMRDKFIALHQSVLDESGDSGSAAQHFTENFKHKLLPSTTPDFEVIFGKKKPIFKFEPITNFFDNDFDINNGINAIKENVSQYGYAENSGGMDLVSGAYLYLILDKLRPIQFVESGIWRGFSSMIFDQINTYGGSHFLFDPGVRDVNFMNDLKYKVNNGKYHDTDIGSSLFSSLGRGATFFFDDHQDHLERLLTAYARGAKYVIFDANYMFGGGGHNSLFDHFRDERNQLLINAIIKKAYVARPLLRNDKGIEPLYSDQNSFSKDLTICDDNYQWLTLLELNLNPSVTKSQGEIYL